MSEQRKRVLIVDDAGLVRRFYREALLRTGFEVDEALNGIEGLEKVLQSPAFDLLIVDINMPQMDGLSFLRALRNQEGEAATIPALVTSTESQSKDMAAARDAGANFYLAKPLNQETLVAYAALMCGVAL